MSMLIHQGEITGQEILNVRSKFPSSDITVPCRNHPWKTHTGYFVPIQYVFLPKLFRAYYRAKYSEQLPLDKTK